MVDDIIPIKDLTTQDILHGDRTTEYRWEVLEHSNGVDQLVGTLDGVSSGDLSWINNAAVKGGGSVTVVDLDKAKPGMLRVADLHLESARLRPVMTINGDDRRATYEDVWVEQARNLALNPRAVASGWASQFSPNNRYWTVTKGVAVNAPNGITTAAKVALTPGDESLAGSALVSLFNMDGLTNAANMDRVMGAWVYVDSPRAHKSRWYAGQFQTVPPRTWTWVAQDGKFPAGGHSGFVIQTLDDSQAVVGDFAYITGVVASADTSRPLEPTDYFDGGTAAPTSYERYRWTGAANSSSSVKEIRESRRVEGDTVIPEIPWGTYLVSSAKEKWRATGRVWELELLDRCTVPAQDAVDQSYAVAAGTPILKEVRSILASCGEFIAVNASSDITTAAGMVWEAGTSKLKIINDLLDVAGYNALWMDGWGNLQVTPRVLPADRSIIYELLGFPRELRDGEDSIYRPDWSRNRDSFDVPNKVIAVQAAGGEDDEALVGVWTNEDPSSPYSYQARGRWIPHVLDSVECPEGTDQEVIEFLQKRAQTTLIQMSAVQAQVTVTHLPIPVRVSDVIRFSHTKAGVDERHIITRTKLELSPTGLMSSTLQEVVSL